MEKSTKRRVPSFENYIAEKSKSIAQQRLFGMAFAVRKGKLDRSEVSDEVLKIADGDMTDKEIEDFAKTKHKDLPQKVDEGSGNELDTFEKLLKSKDWFYMMSDDNRVYKRGQAEDAEIKKVISVLIDNGQESEAKKLWDKYAPTAPYSNSKMAFPGK